MKQGRSINELAAEIKRQQETKADYIADTRQLVYKPEIDVIEINGHGEFTITDHTHSQLQTRLNIPAKYYDLMKKKEPGLLAMNLNYWFNAHPEKRMIRTLDSKARAFLSSRYRPLDNYDLIETILPAIIEADCKIESCEITDSRLYIKAVSERIQAEVKQGDIVQSGLIISNSEIGAGSIRVEPLIYRLACTNGMIAADYGMNARHVGRNIYGDDNNAQELWRNETRKLTDAAFWNQVKDTVGGVLNENKFNRIVNSLKEATETESLKKPLLAVEKLQKTIKFNDNEKDGIISHLINGGDLTKYGVANAITRYSQDIVNYDRATELESIGWEVVKLPKSDWEELINLN